MKNIVIKLMKKEDLEDVTAIERNAFPDPWSYNMFADQLNLPGIYSLITARLDNKVVGYSGLLKIREEGHITNLAVKKDMYRKGIGKTLIYFLFLLALKENISSMALEVRTTNIKAQKLYSLFGFNAVTIRKNYYGYEDDALIMVVEDIGKMSFQERLDKIREGLNYRLKNYVK